MILGDEAVKIGTGDVPDLAALLLAITAFVQWQVGTLLEAYRRAEDELQQLLNQLAGQTQPPQPGQVLLQAQLIRKKRMTKVKLALCSLFEMFVLSLLIWLLGCWESEIVAARADTFSVRWARSLFWTVSAGAALYLVLLSQKLIEATASWWVALLPYIVFALLVGLIVWVLW